MTEQADMQRERSRKRLRRLQWWLAAACALIVLSAYIPLPYYVTRPGSAIELSPMVTVEGGTKDEQGTFMLTTVRMGQATPIWYLYAKLSPDAELIDKNLVVDEGESEEEYTQRELEVMKNSQKLAEAVAFQRAGYDVKIEPQGVLVLGGVKGMPAGEVLKVGDVITRVDQHRVLTADELSSYLNGKKAGDKVDITYERGGRELQAQVALALLPPQGPGQDRRVGLGIRRDNKLLIEVPKKVTIASQGIGGPSAGLMMTLEIFDQLETGVDLTRGYRIAGTGSINPDGTVGRIGGINHKIVAANATGAEIFFAPNDPGPGISNYEEAVETAKKIGSAMKIVPVKTVDDAIRYLKELQPKHA
ncbi:SepM family pheromone-processing serine protease [Brevibacillus massiliensis]|uniref:SepM family pheromone-processing serine protease n=1 Tax=Brevibacillus massiliensis TaxID=1118054 RepID=UPI0003081EC3|nr:SepM family pheromone-processing serine protease [Brevibacillus massiliensis]